MIESNPRLPWQRTIQCRVTIFVTFFDCWDDGGDPVGASRHVRSTLKSDGTGTIVESFAGDKIEENLHPGGPRLSRGLDSAPALRLRCPRKVGLALGAQAGENVLRDVVTAGGLKRFRRGNSNPSNMIFEIRPQRSYQGPRGASVTNFVLARPVRTRRVERRRSHEPMIVIDNSAKSQLSIWLYGSMQTHMALRPAAPGKLSRDRFLYGDLPDDDRSSERLR